MQQTLCDYTRVRMCEDDLVDGRKVTHELLCELERPTSVTYSIIFNHSSSEANNLFNAFMRIINKIIRSCN